jgi:hypothetical protein
MKIRSPTPQRNSSRATATGFFPPEKTVFAWLDQDLSADKSCRQAVAKINADRIAAGLRPAKSATGSYCEARGRVSEDYLHQLAYVTGIGLDKAAPNTWLWRGRHVKLVDGSTFTMADTASNQAEYPQHDGQEEGAGFPIARFVAVMSLAVGAVLDAAIGPYQGKLTGEHALLRQLLHCFEAGDVALGDAYYGSYFLIATLRARGVDCVFRIHGARDVDFRRGKRLGRRDHLVSWKKPRKPEWMSDEEYALFPQAMIVRECCFTVDVPGFRSENITVVTTLVDPDETWPMDLADLYRRRWTVEVNLRTLKSTMKMEHIPCQTPAMARKDFWVHILAYNLIRKLMAQSAWRHNREPWQISFKGAVQTLVAYRNLWLFAAVDSGTVMEHLLDAIRQHVVGNRPDRYEPRMQKRRPKPYPFLKGSREDARCALL